MRGFPLLLCAFIAAASPALAGGNCDLARQVTELDVASRLLLAETQPARAARIVGRMSGDLRAIEPPNPLARPPAPGSAAARMRDYIDSRETLVKVFDDRGLPAAHDFLRTDTTGGAIRNIGTLLKCDAQEGEPGATIQVDPEPGLVLGARVINGALVSGGRTYTGAAIREHQAISWLSLPALVLVIVLLSRLLNHRQYTRYPCDIPAQVTLNDHALNGQIADISRGGAKIRADNAIRAGQRGTVRLESGEAFDFRVAWANSYFIGVTFQPRLEFSPKRLLGH